MLNTLNHIIEILAEAPTEFWLLTITILSLCVGSFLNVVIYRIPKILEYQWHEECREICNINSNINSENNVNNIQKISSSNIILIGYYNPYLNRNKDLGRLFAYINDKYRKIAKTYKITYVDIYNTITSDYLPNSKDYHLNSKGYLKIASKIIEELKL